MKNYKIAVAGTGYVGLSIATLLSQHHQVTAVDIVPEKVEMINNHKSPIQDDYIESERSCCSISPPFQESRLPPSLDDTGTTTSLYLSQHNQSRPR